MPTHITHTEGEAAFMTWFVGNMVPKVHLFYNDFTPDADSPLSAFSEANFTGYLPVTLTDASMVAVAFSTLKESFRKQLNVTFYCGAELTADFIVYGWYVTVLDYAGTTKVLHSHRFGAAQLVRHISDFIQFNYLQYIGDDANV